MFKCTKCKVSKSETEFYSNKKNRDGITSVCKQCSDAYTKEWSKNNKEKYNVIQKRSRLFRYYGVTLEWFYTTLEEQDFSCAVCGIEKCTTGREFSVDHCHKTGEVRGILCHSCNVALGHVGDSVERLTQLIAYLDRHKEERLYKYINDCVDEDIE